MSGNIFAERQKLADIAIRCWSGPVSERACVLALLRLLDGFIPDAGLSRKEEGVIYRQLKPLFADVAARRIEWGKLECDLINIANRYVYEPYRLSVERDFSALIKAHPDKPIQYAIDSLVGDEITDFRQRNPDISPGDEMVLLCRYSPRFDVVMQAVAKMTGFIPYVTSSWDPEPEPFWLTFREWD